jgi:hypothetical protein
VGFIRPQWHLRKGERTSGSGANFWVLGERSGDARITSLETRAELGQNICIGRILRRVLQSRERRIHSIYPSIHYHHGDGSNKTLSIIQLILYGVTPKAKVVQELPRKHHQRRV